MPSNTITERFVAQVGLTPDAVAVSSGETRLTYRELDERSNRLAHRLVSLGVGSETPVAVLLERSVHVPVALLAVLKAGACYLPLHSGYPLDQMQWIMDRFDGPVLLADEAMRGHGLPRTATTVYVDTDEKLPNLPTAAPMVSIHPDQLAYIMHTSGSTGRPKGVASSHRQVLALATNGCWDTGRHERVLMVAPYAFGVSNYEVWVPLLRGSRIVLAPPGELEVAMLRRLITEEKITGLHLTAGLFRLIAEDAPEILTSVREVLTGGDVITPPAVQRVLRACPDVVVRAMYGATECTSFATTATMTAPYEAGTSVPVGRPIDGARVDILDESLRPVAPGVIGEVYMAGTGVARGYAGSPALTAERFVADPSGRAGERMYRTGDRARWTPDGLIDFVGREDFQIKVRGFRVEPAEVAAALANYPGLSDLAVVGRETEPGVQQIVAYLVPEPESAQVDKAALRAVVGERLPEYMVPAAFVTVDSLPLTSNGKLDRDSLPVPKAEGQWSYRAPESPVQEMLCKIFVDVLGVDQVGIEDDFFDLGGQSLLAMRLISRIKEMFDVEISIGALFDASTVAGLAREVEGETERMRAEPV